MTAQPRLLRQPGPVQPVRLHARSGPESCLRLELAPDRTLHEAVVAPLAARGIEAAVLTLLSGPWAQLTWCTGVPDPSGERVATYAAPRTVADALLVAGSATLGRGLDGQPLVHAHGVFAAESEIGGGHLVPEGCVVGAAPTVAFAFAVAGFAIRQRHDVETNHFVLEPVDG